MVILVIRNKPYRLFVQSINKHRQYVVVILYTQVSVSIFMFKIEICGQQSSNFLCTLLSYHPHLKEGITLFE